MKNNTLGQRLSRLRKLNGYTQQEVADMLDLSNKTISSWECDISQPDAGTVPRLADIYGVTCDELLRDGEAVAKEPQRPAEDDLRTEFVQTVSVPESYKQKPFTAAMQSAKIRRMFIVSALSVFGLVIGYLLAFFMQSWLPYGAVNYFSGAFLINVSLLIVIIGFFCIDHSLKEYGETAYPLRRKILGYAKFPFYASLASYVALMPMLGSTLRTKGKLLLYLILAIVLAILCVFPLASLDDFISRRYRKLYEEKQLAVKKKRARFCNIATIVAACVAVVSVSVFYNVNFTPGPNPTYSASFASLAKARETLSVDPLEKYAEKVEILYEDYAANSAKNTITAVYVTRPVYGVSKLLDTYYPEFEAIKLDDKYHIKVKLPVIVVGEYSDTLFPEDSEVGKIIVRNPLYFSSNRLEKKDGKYVIEADVAYDQMLCYNKETADVCVAAVLGATDIALIVAYVCVKAVGRKKRKTSSPTETE